MTIFTKEIIKIQDVWNFTILTYITRSVFDPIKYLFYVSFLLLVLFYIRDIRENFSIKKELIVFGKCCYLFIILVSFYLFANYFSNDNSSVLIRNQLLNILVISFLIIVYFHIKSQIKIQKIQLFFFITTIFLQFLAIIKIVSNIFSLEIYSDHSRISTSLVSDYNFFSNYFFIIIVFIWTYLSKLKSKYVSYLFLIASIIIIFLSGSRRALILLVIIFFIANFYLVFKKKKNLSFYKYIRFFNYFFACFFVIIFLVFQFRENIVTKQESRTKTSIFLYRYATIIYPKISYETLKDILWPIKNDYQHNVEWEKYATYNNLVGDSVVNPYKSINDSYYEKYTDTSERENLLYNGNFQFGMLFWDSIVPNRSNLEYTIREDSFYGKVLRIRNNKLKGYWPLVYKGRKIAYKKGIKYSFEFDYKVIESPEVLPFSVGWWIYNKQLDIYMTRPNFTIRKISNSWNRYTTSIKMESDTSNIISFLNSMTPNSTIEISNIKLTSTDTSKIKYKDQITKKDGFNVLYNSDFSNNHLFWTSKDKSFNEIISTKFGKAIRITMGKKDINWPIIYNGRTINLYKDAKYVFRFKARVVKGHNPLLLTGFNVIDGGNKCWMLTNSAIPIDSSWYECASEYTFKENHFDVSKIFLFYQQKNSVIDYTDIELLVHDPKKRPIYLDQIAEEIKLKKKQEIQKMLLENEKNNSDHFVGTRMARWFFAWELFKKFSIKQILFGNGFSFLTQFAKKFHPNGEEKYDSPHNPIIASFLYSGIIGGFFYTYFLVMVFWNYWKYRKFHMVFFLMYLITFFFMMFSGNSHFSVPTFTILSLVPFVTKYLVKTGKITKR